MSKQVVVKKPTDIASHHQVIPIVQADWLKATNSFEASSEQFIEAKPALNNKVFKYVCQSFWIY